MRRPLRILTVVMAVCFVCAAALAQTNTPAKKPKRPAADAGSAVPTKLDYLPATKAAPMHFLDAPKAVEPTPQQAAPPTQQAAPAPKQ